MWSAKHWVRTTELLFLHKNMLIYMNKGLADKAKVVVRTYSRIRVNYALATTLLSFPVTIHYPAMIHCLYSVSVVWHIKYVELRTQNTSNGSLQDDGWLLES